MDSPQVFLALPPAPHGVGLFFLCEQPVEIADVLRLSLGALSLEIFLELLEGTLEIAAARLITDRLFGFTARISQRRRKKTYALCAGLWKQSETLRDSQDCLLHS